MLKKKAKKMKKARPVDALSEMMRKFRTENPDIYTAEVASRKNPAYKAEVCLVYKDTLDGIALAVRDKDDRGRGFHVLTSDVEDMRTLAWLFGKGLTYKGLENIAAIMGGKGENMKKENKETRETRKEDAVVLSSREFDAVRKALFEAQKILYAAWWVARSANESESLALVKDVVSHTHILRKGRNGAPDITTIGKCKCQKVLRKSDLRKPAIPSVPLMDIAKKLEKEEEQKKTFCGSADIARELGKRVSTISHYATANNIGRLNGTVRVYNADEADMIIKHFREGK